MTIVQASNYTLDTQPIAAPALAFVNDNEAAGVDKFGDRVQVLSFGSGFGGAIVVSPGLRAITYC